MSHQIRTPFGNPEFLVLAGSRLSGMNTDRSDYDYVGALVEPEEYRLGLDTYTQGAHHQHGFEQHTFKGDGFEGTVYSLWKLVKMLADGDPTSLSLIFADPIMDNFGICTDEFRSLVISRRSGHRFMRYMEAQRKSMIGQRAKHVTRTDLIRQHGFDTKFAAHIVRLGYQGIEFLTTGTITLPMPEESLTAGSRLNCLDIRNGLWSMSQVLREAEALEARMQEAFDKSTLPDEPNYSALNTWLVRQYSQHWFSQAVNKKLPEIA